MFGPRAAPPMGGIGGGSTTRGAMEFVALAASLDDPTCFHERPTALGIPLALLDAWATEAYCAVKSSTTLAVCPSATCTV